MYLAWVIAWSLVIFKIGSGLGVRILVTCICMAVALARRLIFYYLSGSVCKRVYCLTLPTAETPNIGVV